MTHVIVEAAFGSTLADTVAQVRDWTDISQYAGPISITRGAESQLSQTQAGTLSLPLDNEDGRFTPENASSPYYPHVVDGVPVRVSIATYTTNLITTPSFEGDPDGDLTGWEWGQAEVLIVGTPTQSGTKAARITWDPDAVGAYFQTAVYGLTIGAQYTASVYVHVPAGNVAAQIRMGGVTSAASAVTDTYTRLSCTFTATAVVMPVQIIPAASPAFGDLVVVDAVQVEEGASATAFDPVGAQRDFRFWGLVTQWPVQWEGLLSSVMLTAVDIFSVLSRGEDQMRPMLVQECFLSRPFALWALDEPSGTSAGDEAGVGAGTLVRTQSGSGGTLEFGAGAAPLGLDAGVLFTPASTSTGRFLRGQTGPMFQEGSNGSWAWAVEVWFSTSTAGRNILTLHNASNDSVLILYLAAGTGYLTVETRHGGGPTTTTVGSVSLADGALHHVVYSSDGRVLWIDGVHAGSWLGIDPVADLETITVGASHLGGNIWAGSISAVALYAQPTLPIASLVDHYACGTTGFAGETADARFHRILTYLGIPSLPSGVFSTGIAEQAALGATALDHLREVEATEGGVLAADRGEPLVRLWGRSVRYNPVPVLAVEWADLEPGTVVAYDLQRVVNSVVVTRPGGATQRLVNAASRETRGPIGRTVDTLATTDLTTADIGNWILQRYAQPATELRSLTVNVYTLGLAAYRQWLAADIGTPMTVTGMPAQAPAPSMGVTIEGYVETISEKSHVLECHTSPTVTATVWVLGDPVYSVLGSTTRLAY
ncbi:LamG-like jellyroll fold domain-containing protein [Streptomyces sp. NPDC058629]|uniref:LamG-like jellyroll fold domain-containing protein n=1 Tax=Streptomyces sp. NPDC058629 TaxID=3346565 RepID=UPI003649ABE0